MLHNDNGKMQEGEQSGSRGSRGYQFVWHMTPKVSVNYSSVVEYIVIVTYFVL